MHTHIYLMTIYVVIKTTVLIIDHYILTLRYPPSILLLNFQLKSLLSSPSNYYLVTSNNTQNNLGVISCNLYLVIFHKNMC